MKWVAPFLIFLVLESTGNFLTGLFYYNQHLVFLLTILAIYAVGNFFWLISLKKGTGLARGAVLFSIGIILITASIGVFYYDEEITLLKFFGIILGVASLLLMTEREVKGR